MKLPIAGDWAPLWTAGRLWWTNPSGIYDFELIGQLQHPVTGNTEFHPYIYPPSALLLIAPISLMPFWVSAAVVVASALGLLVASARAIGSDASLVLLSPPLFLAAMAGQISLLIIGLAVLACALLDRNGRTAGILLAVAAIIKPTLLILAPLGLIAGRHWGALAAAITAGITGLAASVILIGLQPWFEWFEALPRFQRIFAENEALIRNAVSPSAFAVRNGMESMVVSLIFAVTAAALTCIGFTRSPNAGERSVLIMGGALLLAPYSMHYELAAVAPALFALSRDKMRNLVACAIWGFSLFVNLSAAGLLAAYCTVIWPLISSKPHQSGELATSR